MKYYKLSDKLYKLMNNSHVHNNDTCAQVGGAKQKKQNIVKNNGNINTNIPLDYSEIEHSTLIKKNDKSKKKK